MLLPQLPVFVVSILQSCLFQYGHNPFLLPMAGVITDQHRTNYKCDLIPYVCYALLDKKTNRGEGKCGRFVKLVLV